MKFSIGDFVLTGGELAAIPNYRRCNQTHKRSNQRGVFPKRIFSPLLEHDQYTKPVEYKGQKVPSILLSGNHAR